MQSYDISLDMKKAAGRIERTVVVRRGDNDTQQISAAITAGGQPYEPNGAARLDILHADGTWARCSASVSGSTVSCTLPSEALNGVGRCRAAHFVFTDGEKVESTEGFALVIEGNVDTDGTPAAQGYDDELSKLNQKWSKLNAEAERAESDRVAKEAERADSEADRKAKETERASAESERKAAETERKGAEEARKAAETARAQAEQARADAEKARKAAEQSRSTAETARAEAERARAAAQAKNNADQALNNEQMKKLSPVILQEGQYDRATLKPTIEGEPNRMYFVPMVAPAAIELYDLTPKQVEAGNLYVEWMWVGGKWEQMGQSEIKARPISTDQVDAVFSGAHPTGDDVLNLTGLDYTHGKVSALLDGKADKAHQHAVADVTGLRGELDGKAGTGHKHGAGDITSGTLHVDRVPELPIAKVSGLQGALDGKQPKGSYANASHRHNTGDINNLDSQLNGIRDSLSQHIPTELLSTDRSHKLSFDWLADGYERILLKIDGTPVAEIARANYA